MLMHFISSLIGLLHFLFEFEEYQNQTEGKSNQKSSSHLKFNEKRDENNIKMYGLETSKK